MRRILLTLLTIAVVPVVILAAAFLMIDWNRYEGDVEDMLTAATGRTVAIGNLDVSPGWTTTVRLQDLVVDNADWAQAPELLKAEEAELGIRVWPLVLGRISVSKMTLTRPVLNLERGSNGQSNWNLARPAEAVGEVVSPEGRREFPAIDRLLLKEGRVAYRDPRRALRLEGRIDNAEGDAAGEDRMELALDGTLEGRPFRLNFTGGSLARLRTSDRPYPIDLEIRLGKTTVTVKGSAMRPVTLRDLDLSLIVEGPSLADIFPLFRIPLPATPPYRLAGRLLRDGEFWRFERFSGSVGDSDLNGWVAADYSRPRPFFTGDLTSRKLDLDDMAGLIGAVPDPDETAAPRQRATAKGIEGLFPDILFDTERMHAMNMDLRFAGEEVVAPDIPINRLGFRVRINDGRTQFYPLEFEVAGGRIAGEVAVNSRDDPPSADVDLSIRRVGLKPFFRDSEFAREMGGRITGNLYLIGSGRSLQRLLATADGGGRLLMEDGTLSGLLVERVGVDVIESLALAVGGDTRVDIRCAHIGFTATQGRLTLDRGFIDTADSLIVTAGSVDLGAERLDLQIEARAKDFSLIDLAAPVVVSGPLEDPTFEIGEVEPLDIVALGGQDNLDCETLSDDVGKTMPAP